MSAILKFNFQKRKQLHFQKKIIWTTQKDTILHVTITFSLKQGQARTSNEPIWVPSTWLHVSDYRNFWNTERW